MALLSGLSKDSVFFLMLSSKKDEPVLDDPNEIAAELAAMHNNKK